MSHDFDGEYWDRVWSEGPGAAMAATPPNPHLLREVSGLAPGTALEAGCGAGTEALWLASRRWQVTAVDLAAEPLEIAARRAEESGRADKMSWLRADLSDWTPTTHFDLVTTHYAHPTIPQLDFYERLAGWVAPGGTLLIVGHLRHGGHGHDQERQHEHGHGHGHKHGQERQYEHGHAGGPTAESASVTAADITARLAPGEWAIETAEESHRDMTGPGGRVVTVHDVVVRASRVGGWVGEVP